MSALRAFVYDEHGAVLTEYGVLMASFAILTIAGLLLVSQTANATLSNIFTSTTSMEQCPPGTTGC
jgi:Flp pilus assembly pilin Flp